MAKNKLTPEQDLLTREFYEKVAASNELFPQDPVGQGKLKSSLMRLLGYDTPVVKTYTYGCLPHRDISQEWADDRQAAKEALNEDNNRPDSDETDTGEPTESSEVRSRVLPEDVQ